MKINRNSNLIELLAILSENSSINKDSYIAVVESEDNPVLLGSFKVRHAIDYLSAEVADIESKLKSKSSNTDYRFQKFFQTLKNEAGVVDSISAGNEQRRRLERGPDRHRSAHLPQDDHPIRNKIHHRQRRPHRRRKAAARSQRDDSDRVPQSQAARRTAHSNRSSARSSSSPRRSSDTRETRNTPNRSIRVEA